MAVNRLIILWQRLLDEYKRTCPRCVLTGHEVEKAAARLKLELRPLGIDVRLVKRGIDPEGFKKNVMQSNKVVIAGKALEEWLGAETGQSPCCEVCGNAECRTVEYADRTHETIPADLIVKAGLIAASQVFNIKLPRAVMRKKVFMMRPGKC